MEQKYCYIVDATLPGDDSLVKFEGGLTLITLEEGQKFIEDNQSELAEPQVLGEGLVVTHRYQLNEL
jgi:hypothetical protein